MSHRSLLVVLLVIALPLTAFARRRSRPAEGPTVDEIAQEWVLQGDESDAIVESGFEQGDEKDAVYREGVIDGGELMAVFENELPKGAAVVEPGDRIAPDGERPGMRVVPGADKIVPGGMEPGMYDGTKDTGQEIWRLESFLKKGGRKFRPIGDRVFEAAVDVVEHKSPRWKWGSHTTEEVTHTKKWRKVLVGEKVIEKRVGKKIVNKRVDYRVVRKMKTEPGDDGPPKMMPVRCPVYKRYLVPEMQRYKVPVYKWEEVNVGTYARKSFLTWIKRYRLMKGTYVVWKYWGTTDEFLAKYPERTKELERARSVTDRVFRERRQLLAKVFEPTMDTYLRTKEPEEDRTTEFFLDEKRRSINDGTKKFVEMDVPEAELVVMRPK